MSSPLSARALLSFLSSTPTKTSNIALHLSRVLSSAQGIDATLCTLSYTLTFVHSQLLRLLSRQYEQIALRLTATTATVNKTPTSSDSPAIPSLYPPVTRLSETCASINSLSALISDFRIFLRLWDLLHIYSGARGLYLSPPRDPVIKLIRWTQVGTDTAFQALENGAYLASKGVLRGEKWAGRVGKWFVWSSRFWLASVVLEMARLARVKQLRFNEDFGAEQAKGEEDEKAVKIRSRELQSKWWRGIVSNSAWLPLTLHWSFEDEAQSPFGEAVVGGFGMVAGVIKFRKIWADNAV